MLARNVAELTQGLPYLRYAMETQELPPAGLHLQPRPSAQGSFAGEIPSSDECLLEDQCPLLARNVAELTQGPPVLRQAIKTQELPPAGLSPQPRPSEQGS